MNKVDLIFQRQPPQVQKKLMNLLIQYNAMMKYNKESDQFQVDFLLPFSNQREKSQFLQKFQSRSHNKSKSSDQKGKQQNEVKSYRIEKIKQQIQNSHQLNVQDNFEFSQESDNLYQNDSERYSDIYDQNLGSRKSRQQKIKQQEQQISYDFTLSNQNDISQTNQTKSLSIKKVSTIIKTKIDFAIGEIRKIKQNKDVVENKKKSKNLSTQTNSQKSSKQRNLKKQTLNEKKNIIIEEKLQQISKQIKIQIDRKVNYQKNQSFQKNENRFKIIPVQMQDYRQKVSPYKLNSYNTRQKLTSDGQKVVKSKEKKISHFVTDKRKNKYDGLEDSNNMQNSGKLSSRSSEIKNQILIQENMSHHNDFQFDTSIGRSEQKNRQNSIKRKKYQTNVENQKQVQNNRNNVQQRLTDRYGIKRVSMNMRQKYVQFVKKNHQQFGRIYENIKKNISKSQSRLKNSRRQDPILVLQQDLYNSVSEEDRIFKQEIIKDYHKHIIAHNQNMSSQDLVRYFRYLLQHAKNLYIKHLRKGR